MRGRLDVKEVEAALREAVVRAVYGTREDRSGRFLPVRSPVMTSIKYDESTAGLEIKFSGGMTNRYQNIPVEIYVGLRDAKWKGQFFIENIQGAFAFTEVSKRSP
jgi:hypothetical protein